jgi:hypothetical protein
MGPLVSSGLDSQKLSPFESIPASFGLAVQVARLCGAKTDTFGADPVKPDNNVDSRSPYQPLYRQVRTVQIAYSNNLGGSTLTFDANVGIGILLRAQIGVFWP